MSVRPVVQVIQTRASASVSQPRSVVVKVPGPQGPKGDKGDKGDTGLGVPDPIGTEGQVVTVSSGTTVWADPVVESVNSVTGAVVLDTDDVEEGSVSRYVKTFADDSARSSAIASPTEGMLSYLADTDAVEVYDGSAWVGVGLPLGTATPAEGDTLTYGTATASWNPSPAGQVLSVASVYQPTDQTITSTWPTYVDLTGLSVTVTPKSSSSKFLLLFSGTGEMTSTTTVYTRFERDSASVAEGSLDTNANTYRSAFSAHYYDSPATASAITYKVTSSRSGGTSFSFFNSNFTVIEVAS